MGELTKTSEQTNQVVSVDQAKGVIKISLDSGKNFTLQIREWGIALKASKDTLPTFININTGSIGELDIS